MTTVYLRGGEITDMGDVHRAFAQALNLPAWYGENLDALYDCLTTPGQDLTVVLCGRAALSQALGRRFRTLLRVFSDAAEENPRLHVLTLEEGRA